MHAAPTTEWRFGRGWSTGELEAQMQSWAARPLTSASSEHDPQQWYRYHSRAVIALEPPGLPVPGGPFQRARVLVARYEFSDPRIVTGHFDPRVPLLGRSLLLELKVMGLRYLCGVTVTAVRDETTDHCSVYGFRYDTQAGHIERGDEWFILTKDHTTGEVHFRIEATWHEAEFPNWWSRVGFALVGRRYQRAWHRLAHLRLRQMLCSQGLPELPRGARLLHEGPMLPAPRIGAVAGAAPPADLQDEDASPGG